MKLKKCMAVACSFVLFVSLSISIFAQNDTAGMNANAASDNQGSHFTDMSGHWSEASVERLTNAGIINGYPDGTFKPDSLVTRAEVAKIICLAFELDQELDQSILIDYPDVREEDWFFSYVTKAGRYMPEYGPYESGRPYTDPYINNNNSNNPGFLPNQADLRMFLAETLSTLTAKREGKVIDFPEYKVIKAELSAAFIDSHFSEEITDPHGNTPSNYIQMLQSCWAAWKMGIFEGDDNHWFGPMEPVTRAALAVTIDRVLSGENNYSSDIFKTEKTIVLPEKYGTGSIQSSSMKGYTNIWSLYDDAYEVVLADVIQTEDNILYDDIINIAPSIVQVIKGYKGKLENRQKICIEETGIRQEDGDLAIDGVPLLGENMRVLLFLTEPSNAVQKTREGYGILGVYQGKYFVDQGNTLYASADFSDNARTMITLPEENMTWGDLETLYPYIVKPGKHL